MRRLASASAAALFLAGCASFTPDGGFDRVRELTRERTGQSPTYQRTAADTDAARVRVAELLKQPLTADAAVELAFLGNRSLQASFTELGIAESDLVRAGRLRNPSFGFGRLREGSGTIEIERSLMFDLLGLLTMPVAKQVEQHRFEQRQLQTAYEAVGLAAEVRRSYFSAVAAEELVRYAQQVLQAAEASSELAGRMLLAGNFSKLDQLREQAFHADAVSQLARARQRAVAERERLTRLLGLSGEQLGYQLPQRLPELPEQAVEPQNAEQTAMDRRLDLLMTRRSAEATAKSLGLTRATRFVNVLELGYRNQSVSGEPRADGYEIEFELPLFDFGSTRTARAEATYLRALHLAADAAVQARSEVRESYSAYRTSYDLAKHYRDEVVPLKKRISEEQLLRYNGMLIGVFDLLADAREQIAGVTGYVEALRDFWIADTDLQTALTGRSPGVGAAPPPSSATASPRARDH